MTREAEQFVGQVLHDADGHRVGRILAVAEPVELQARRWLIVGRWLRRQQLHAVPLHFTAWSDRYGIQVSCSRDRVAESPTLDQATLDDEALQRLERFWAST